MDTVTIPKTEYSKLKRYSSAYLKIVSEMAEIERDLFSSPPVRNISQVVKSFKDAKKYNHDFIKSLEKGLRRSSLFK